MKITSKQELLELRKQKEELINLRETGKSSIEEIQVLVGMATCGIASGAKDTYEELNKLIKERNINNVSIIKVGCLGYCVKEPTLQVCKPGKEPELFGFITKDKAVQFLEDAVLSEKGMPENKVVMSFNKVVD